MIDVHLLRTDPDAVAARLKARGFALDARAFRELEEQRRKIQTETEQVQ